MADVKKAMVGGSPWATYAESSGNDVTLYCLASSDPLGASGAFSDLKAAIGQAKDFIFVVDWSFQPYTRLASGALPFVTDTIGNILNERANDGVLVAVHTWDHTNLGAADPQNDDGGARLDAIAKSVAAAAGKKGVKRRSSNFLWRASSRTGVGWSHHQKFVVMDAPGSGGRKTIKAFFGGLDVTKGRFDWGEHRLMALPTLDGLTAPLRDSEMEYDDWYSAEFTHKKAKFKDASNPGRDEGPGDPAMPRQPWQDIYAQITGPTAWDVVREFTGRWLRDAAFGVTQGDNSGKAMDTVQTKFISLFDKGAYVQQWEPGPGPFTARVVRSLVRDHWGEQSSINPLANTKVEVAGEKGQQRELVWTLKGGFEQSIHEAYVRAIKQADRFIYIETQYLISSGAHWSEPRPSVGNDVARAVANRIADKIDSEEEFHAYVVTPMFPEGDPVDGTIQSQRRLEWSTMEMMATIVTTALKAKKSSKDWRDYLSFYFLANWSARGPVLVGNRRARVLANQRYQIYVHSKLLIIDDEFLILGSANLNERSLAGDRDSEICVYLRPSDGQIASCKKSIQGLRQVAWQQHFGSLPTGWDEPHKAACVGDVRKRAADGWNQVREGSRADQRQIVSIPLSMSGGNFHVDVTSKFPLEDPFLIDAATKASVGDSGPEWMWPGKDRMLPGTGHLAE